MKLISPWKNKRKIILIVILVFLVGGAFFWRLNNLLAEVKFATSLRERTLLIVIENDFGVSSEMEKYYEKYKNLADIFFSFIFKVNKRDLNGKNLAEVIDSYGEDYLAGRFKSAAKGYGKVVILTDEKASYNNFKETLVSLNDEGKIIDILLDLHGGPDVIDFYGGDYIYKKYMSYDISQKPLNLGYVYQTLCYGGENEEIWLDLGAKVVNGAKGGNNFVLLAPEKFLYLWTHGKTFLEAVNGGFNFEVMISRIVPILSVRDEDIESGQMIFAGDNYYSLK